MEVTRLVLKHYEYQWGTNIIDLNEISRKLDLNLFQNKSLITNKMF